MAPPLQALYLKQKKVQAETRRNRSERAFLVYRHEDYETAIRLVAENKVRLEPLMSKHFPFDEYAEAYRYIDKNRENTMKVLIDVA